MQAGNTTRVGEALLRGSLGHDIDGDGDYHLTVHRDAGDPIHVYIVAELLEQDILQVRSYCPSTSGTRSYLELLGICNTWNANTTFPKAYVTVATERSQADLTLEHTCLGSDVSAMPTERILLQVATFIEASLEFWSQAERELG